MKMNDNALSTPESFEAELEKCNSYKKALALLEQMRTLMPATTIAYHATIKCCIHDAQWPKVFHLLHDMEEQGLSTKDAPSIPAAYSKEKKTSKGKGGCPWLNGQTSASPKIPPIPLNHPAMHEPSNTWVKPTPDAAPTEQSSLWPFRKIKEMWNPDTTENTASTSPSLWPGGWSMGLSTDGMTGTTKTAPDMIYNRVSNLVSDIKKDRSNENTIVPDLSSFHSALRA